MFNLNKCPIVFISFVQPVAITLKEDNLIGAKLSQTYLGGGKI